MTAPPPKTINFEALFGASPNPYVLVAPDLSLVAMNDAYLAATLRKREDLVGRTMFEAFPSDPTSDSYQLLNASLARVFETGLPDEIALIRYDIPLPTGEIEQRYWSATHTPMLDPEGKVAFVMQHTVDVTELQRLRAIASDAGRATRAETDVYRRAHAVQETNLSLSAETQQLRTLFEQAPGFVAVVDGLEQKFTMANAAYRRLVGDRDIVGKTVKEALPEVVDQGFVQLLHTVRTSGEPFIGRGVRVFLKAEDSDQLEERVLDFIYQPIIAHPGKEATGIFVQGHDVTEQYRAEEHQKLLINELNHRVKNTLSIVQALAMQSFSDTADPATSRQAFDARLNALSAAHNLLTMQNWEGAGLVETVRASVSATAGANVSRFTIDGPDISLPAQTAVSLAMAIHELCTNAIKYGALSNDSGTVDVRWTAEKAETEMIALTFVWTEDGGPTVTAPDRRGFGTRLIERGLSAELRSKVTMDFRPEGLRCIILAKLTPAE